MRQSHIGCWITHENNPPQRPCHEQRLIDCRRHSRCLDDQIRSSPMCRTPDPHHGVALSGIEGGTQLQLLCASQFPAVDIHQQDLARAHELRPLGQEHTDRPRSQNRDRIARLENPLPDRMQRHRRRFAQSGLYQIHAWGKSDQIRLGYASILGKASVVAGANIAIADALPIGTDLAIGALATRDERLDDHPLPDGMPGLADGLSNEARDLVPRDQRERIGAVLIHAGQVRATDADSGHPNQGLTLAQSWQGDALIAQVADAVQNQGGHGCLLHRSTPTRRHCGQGPSCGKKRRQYSAEDLSSGNTSGSTSKRSR